MPSHLIERWTALTQADPQAVAVIDPDGTHHPRGDFWRVVQAWSVLLHQQVPAKGVVMTVLPNGAASLVAMLGALRADRAVLPVSPGLTAHEWQAIADAVQPTVVIGNPEALEALADRVPHRHLPSACMSAPVVVDHVHEGTGAVLMLSSGTTGRPKIVRRSAHALDAVAINCMRALQLTEADRMYTAIPLHHSYAIDHAVGAAGIAGTALVTACGFQPDHAVHAIVDQGVSVFPGVPVMFEHLIPRAVSGTRLRRVYSAGSPLPMDIAQAFEKAWGIRIGQIYGSTEFASVAWNDPDVEPFDPVSVGRPMDGVRFKIRAMDESHRPPLLPADVEGQIAVASPSMCDGDQESAADEWVDGMLLSGDLGRLDKHGRLWLTGRVKLLADVGGLKVNLVEVEMVLCEHPMVAKAVVMPVSLSATTHRLKAFVQPRPEMELDIEDVRRFLRDRLVAYKIPREFAVMDSLPCTSTGKVIRSALSCA